MFLMVSASATDISREQDYASALRQMPMTGKVIWLRSEGRDFIGLYTEAEKTDNANAAIILHDLGQHPDQKPVIHGLRTMLPRGNWTTLSLQMPLREAGAGEADYYPLFAEAGNRLRVAVDFLQKNGAKNIVVVGYGLGALMAAYAISEKPDNISALAVIGMGVPDTTATQAQSLAFIKNIALPLLDIYAEFDLPPVILSARLRRMAGKDNPVYRQVSIPGDDHAYQQDHERLVKRVYSWLTSIDRQ